MRTTIECLECLAGTFGKQVKDNCVSEEQGYEIMCKISDEIANSYKYGVPADIGTKLCKILLTYFPDLMKREKEDSKRKALEIVETFKGHKLTLDFAVQMAVFGNVMDYSVRDWNPNNIDLTSILGSGFKIDHIKEFEYELSIAKKVMYLTDNAGEVVFDSFLARHIKNLGKHLILSPKESPIQNDATMEDIRNTPLDAIADAVIPTAQAVGLDLKASSVEFHRAFKESDLVIMKGMGYFENGFDVDKNTFFILKAKCEPVARILGVQKGDNILLGKKYFNKA